MQTTYYELNLDGLVGPTHNYAGLAQGNLASVNHAFLSSNPKAAALPGLEKMRLLHNMGLKQAILPPHQRPNLALLHQMGFTGTVQQQLNKVATQAPYVLSACFSASSMWAANAATVSASMDTADKRVHFTAANLISNLHRYQEAPFSMQLLQYLFNNDHYFFHHDSLPGTMITRDEGAANHSRLCLKHNQVGINLFVYGKKTMHANNNQVIPHQFPARQTYEASCAIAYSHQLDPNIVVFAQQNPTVIDEGVFHNDVISVANESVLLVHEHAYVNQPFILNELQEKANFPLTIIEIKTEQLTVAEAVSSYLFNSQLVTLPDNSMALIAPIECKNNPSVANLIGDIINDANNPLRHVHFMDLKQSMQNGGGPACLRLRVPLNESELSAMHQKVLVNDQLLTTLENWVKRHYRSELNARDLVDPLFIDETMIALDELTQLLNLGTIYPFQQEISN